METWRHKDGTVRVDHMDAREGDYFGGSDRSMNDRLAEIQKRHRKAPMFDTDEDVAWLVAALVAERALSDALAAALEIAETKVYEGAEFLTEPAKFHRARAKALLAHRSARAGLTDDPA
jgi:hypothetical protein